MIVGVCTPHGGLVQPLYIRNLAMMEDAWKHKHTFVHIEIESMIVGKARNLVSALAREQKVDVVLFVDDDVLIPINAGELIDQAMEFGVVSGIYFNRRTPFNPQIYKAADEHGSAFWPIMDYPKEGDLFPIDAAGAGCLAVRSDIFDLLKASWENQLEDLPELPEPFDRILRGLSPWFEFLDRQGEDFYFSNRVREAGLQMYANPNVKCGHIGPMIYQEEHFQYLVENDMLHRVDENGNLIIESEEEQNE